MAEEPKQVHLDKSMGLSQRLAALPGVLTDPADVQRAATILRDRTEETRMRAAVLQRLSAEMRDDQGHVDLAIAVMKDATEPKEVRVAALKALQGASFHSPLVEASRPEWMAALRESARDEDPEIRQRVLGVLAQRKDGFAQQLLIEGLQNPAAALVPPETAIELLAYDTHGEHYPLLREIAERSPSEAARQQAIRSLAADPAARPQLMAILRNRAESVTIRCVAAHALRTLDPAAFEREAKTIILADTEPDDLRITCLVALTLFGDRAALRADGSLIAAAERLRNERADAPLGEQARKFLEEMRKP